MRLLFVSRLREGSVMPHRPRTLTRFAPLDRSFEASRYQERFLATAFEAALPIVRRRIDRTGPRREHQVALSGRMAQER